MKSPTAIFIVALYLFFCGVNWLFAWFHNLLREKAIKNKTKAISHGWWGLLYIAICAGAYFPVHQFWIFGAIIPLHATIFAVVLNRYSDLPAFHLSKTTTALWDRFQVKLGMDSIEDTVVVCQFISIIFLTLSIILK